jgi:UDP-N-acetyl-D-mannosaminuronic acid dehydrogenase
MPSDYFAICVPTPIDEDKRSDLQAVRSAAESILQVLRKGSTVILESTVPPGTTREVVVPILERSGLKGGTDFYAAYCPERVLPGQILRELVDNDRVIGGINATSTAKAKALYTKFVQGTLHEATSDTAEMVKLVENAYRDVNIAFANELASVCDALSIDVWSVINLANRHPRVNVLSPGPGVGGHCIAVDPWFIVEKAPEVARLIRTSREVNDARPTAVVDRVAGAVKGISKPRIGCLGLTYKRDVDDVRESPAMTVAEELVSRGYEVLCHDPFVERSDRLALGSLEDAFRDTDCVVVLVDHKAFRALDWQAHVALMRQPRIIDTRGIVPEAFTRFFPSPATPARETSTSV